MSGRRGGRVCLRGAGRVVLLVPIWLLLFLVACGADRDPVQRLSRELSRYPEYSVIVDDLRVDEGFSPDYYLQFKVMTASGQRVAGVDTLEYKQHVTPWEPVSEAVFARYENYVGMVVASKDLEGRTTGPRQAYPAGYQYVGNPHYGSWGGGGFWQFYGQYALMQNLMGGWQVNRNDFGDYRRNRDRGQAYYGPERNGRRAFGSQGTVTEKSRPGFYKRNHQRLSSGRQSFASRAQSRMGRTSSSWGRGSSRFGK